MARKHRPERPAADSMILPFDLVVRQRLTASEASRRHKARTQWFRDRDIDPGDWSQVYPVLKASWAAYGIPGALDRHRARFRAQVLAEECGT